MMLTLQGIALWLFFMCAQGLSYRAAKRKDLPNLIYWMLECQFILVLALITFLRR